MEVERQLVDTEVEYYLLLLGKDFNLPCGMPVTVTYGGKAYQTKTHSVQVGRIDGLSDLYEDFPLQVGDSVRAVYEPSTNTVMLSNKAQITVERQLTDTEVEYYVLLLGKDFNLPKGMPVTVTYGGKAYQTKTHNSKTGAIYGLSDLYKDFPLQVGDSIRAVYEPSTNTVALINKAQITVDRQLTDTEVEYYVLLLGKDFNLPKGMPVTVTYGGKAYQSKMHKTKTGAIYGLSDLYQAFPLKVGDSIRAVYELSTNTVALS